MSTRDDIIDAAMAIVRDQGVGKLTLDGAAVAAGLSKGGVLYHFRSKDALVEGMVERLIGQCEALQQRHYAGLPEGPNRWLKAMVAASFDAEGPSNDPVGNAILAAVALNPKLLGPFQAKYREWLARVEQDSSQPGLGILLLLAMDGLWLQDMLGMRIFDEDRRRELCRCAFAAIDSGVGSDVVGAGVGAEGKE
jgi:AcrR family transcriptional regulator